MRYDYSAMTPETVRQAADEGLTEAEALVGTVVDLAGPRTFENTLAPLSEAAAAVWTADGRGALLGEIHPDPTVRDAANEARERTAKWRESLAQRDDVAAAVRAYAATDDANRLEGSRRRVLDLWLRDLERAGHELEPAARAELAALRARLVELIVVFGRRLLESTDAIELAPGDVAGLSADFIGRLPAGASPGSRSLPISWSTVLPFLEQSDRRDLRESALRKYLSRAADENRPILDELLAVRRRIAAIMGAPSWSQFANEARMSGGAEAVRAFLDRIVPPLQDLAIDERARMWPLVEAAGATDALQAWDWFHCTERQRRATGVDSSELAAHLPLDAVLGGLFDIVRTTFGVEVTEDPTVRAWHADVRAYTLRDATTGEHLADCYLDLFAREGKSPGAWQTELAPASNRRGHPRTPPVLLLVTNCAGAAGGRRPTVEHMDVVMLFHEFGHVLEAGLQRAEVFPVAWSWSELDFIEAPSQIMEHWAWDPDVLRRFARHHETGAPPPDALLDRLAPSRRLNVGTSTLWYGVYRALLDQALHGPEPIDPADAYRAAFAATGFPFVEGTFQPSSFSHLDNYDAGFYSYLWAQVFGDDMFSAFRAGGVLSPEVGRRYRAEVLEPSWTVPGRERVRNFLGREPSEDAFLERLGIGGSR